MLRRALLLSALAFLPSYSYCESILPYYGYTGNAAANGLQWNMGQVLPEPPGLSIQNVIYSYRIQKETGEWVTVYVQNELANGNGYVFRERDDWKPGSQSGLGINKVVPVGDLHRSLWGNGSIEVEGNGSVTDANVVYTYKVDPCYDPQFSPNCPGYKLPPLPDIPVYGLDDIYDVSKDENVKLDRSVDKELLEVDEEEEKSEEELAKEKEMEEERSKMRLEQALAAAENALLFAASFEQSQRMEVLSLAVDISSYTTTTINGGVYNETVTLQQKQLPENKNGLRNGLAQQLLHEKMVEMQFK